MLHIGCGEVAAPGYINIDARRLPHVHFVLHDLRDLDWVPERSVDLVYLSHVLEHVPHPELASVLRSLVRPLKAGGVLRLAVPDIDLIFEIYRSSGSNVQAILGPLMGGQDYPQNFHFGVFNDAWLRNLMTRAGLEDLRTWMPERTEHHDFVDWSWRQFEFDGRSYPVSLNLEGVKR
jgi:predicted SAM-dependent methyltransferase